MSFSFVNNFVYRFHCARKMPGLFSVVYSCLGIVCSSLIPNLFLSLYFILIFFFLVNSICVYFVFTHSNNYPSLIKKFSMFTFSGINYIIVFITCILFYVGYLFYCAVFFFFFIILLALLYLYYFPFLPCKLCSTILFNMVMLIFPFLTIRI